MSNTVEDIELQACEWLAVMNSDRKTEAEVREFQQWLAADPSHRSIYYEVETTWSKLVKLKNEIDSASYRPARVSSLYPGLRGRFANLIAVNLQRTQYLVVFTGLLLATVLSIVLYSSRSVLVDDGGVATQVAEIRTINLPDGSTIVLGALSAIDVDYQRNERRIAMVSGEAFFSVAKDPDRPFIVTTADTEIRVVGTQFDVRRSAEVIRISVLEGQVEVTTQNRELKDSQTEDQVPIKKVLNPKQQLYTSTDGTRSELYEITPEIPGAWRNGMLIYENAKLSEVISDADRYYSGNIFIDTEDLKALLVSAAFRTSQIDEMMETLSTVLPISIQKLSNGDFVLRRDEPDAG